MSDVQEYPEVVQEVRGALNPGRLKLQSNSVTFKNIKTGKVDQYQSTDIESVHWLKRARGYCLKIILNNGLIHRYDGFKDNDYDKLSTFVSKYYKSDLEKIDLALKGWNWGKTDFVGNGLEFKIDSNLAFELPLGNVSHSTTSKNEVTLEFHLNDDAAVSLTELRFHIPTDPNPEVDSVTDFYNNVLAKADIIQATGDAVVTFPEAQCLTPRGRYDIKLYPTFLQLHGKTFDYKVPYTTVLRLFLLPHKDSRQMFFVVSLDPPIKQGQTRYHFLILLFNKEDEMTVELGMTEEELKVKYDGKLSPEMHGLEYEVVSKIFKAITNRKITVPGSFEGQQGMRCVSCSYKAATGLFYPLERGFIFVHKPPLHIRFDEISCVNFARGSGNTRSFDFEIETLSAAVYHFVGIEKDEYGKLFDFVSSKKLRVKNIDKKKNTSITAADLSGSDEEGGDHDAYLERMKAEGKQREDDAEDDETDSSDESFNPGESGSEVAEEYDSNPPTTDSDDSETDSGSGGSENSEARKERKKKKEKEREEKREAKEKKKKKASRSSEGREKKRSGKKTKREKGQPKRPQTSYFLWLNEIRESIKEDNPGISIIDVSKKAGELWKKVEDKTKWEKLAEEAKKDYAKAMEIWNNRPVESDDEKDDDDEGGKSSGKKEKKKKRASSSPLKKLTDRAGAGDAYKSKEFISDSSSEEEKSPKKRPKKEEKTEKKRLRKDGSESEKELPSEPDEATPNPSEDSGHSGDEGSGSE